MVHVSCCGNLHVAVSSPVIRFTIVTYLTEVRYMLLAVIAEGLFDCEKVNSLKYLKVWVVGNVFRYFANVIILYIILFPLVNRMMKHARWEGHPIIGHWILMAFVSIFMLLFVIMWNYNLIHGVTGQKTTDSKYGIEATYITLYLVAALYTAGHLLSSRIQIMKIKASTQVRRNTPIFSVSKSHD
jgi:hypothetical protein